MSDDVLEKVAAGMLGKFWWLLDGVPQQPLTMGHIHRDEDGFWVVEVEGWRSMGDGEEPEGNTDTYPETMIGVLGGATVFLSDRRRLTDQSLWSGQRIHVLRARFETVVTGVDVNKVDTDGIVEAEVQFPNQNPWDRSERPHWRLREEDEPLGRGWSLDLPSLEPTRLPLGGGVTLTVLPTWGTSRDIEMIQVNPALSLQLSSATPTATSGLVQTFEWMQDLIGHCWGGRVLPVPGAGRVNAAQEDAGRFSSQRLLERHHVELADLSRPFPVVHLPDLGGPRAFVRWVILCRHFARATRGVSEGLYVGASAETRLLNTASAMAYWVGAHKRRHSWAALVQGDADNDARRLVMHQLPTFDTWVGDGELFSARLWWDYNSLKHDPAHEIDYRVVQVFTTAARWMLIGSLLDRVAGTTLPSKRIAEHFWQLRNVTKELLDETGRCEVPEDGYRRRRRRNSQANQPAATSTSSPIAPEPSVASEAL